MQKINFQVMPKSNFLLTAALFLLFCNACSIQHKYVNEARKWEKNIARFDSLNKAEHYSKEAILFTGSSSIVLWSTIKEDVAPYNVIQRGFGGSKFSDLACYIDKIAYPHELKAIVIYEGNDIAGTKWDKTPAEIGKIFRYIVKKIRREFPQEPVFVIGLTLAESRKSAWPKIRETNFLLSRLSDRLKNVHYISTDTCFLNKNGETKAELFRPDKLHLNREGYTIWSKVIKQKLDEVFQN